MTATSGRSAASRYPQLSGQARAEVADRLGEIIALRHTGRLAADQLEEVRSEVAAQLDATERLHQYPLTNDQEPFFVVRNDPGVTA